MDGAGAREMRGAPVTADGQLIGIVRHERTCTGVSVPHQDSHINFTLISAVLSDMNSNGGPGAGFTPI
jgi:hypothetical protein